MASFRHSSPQYFLLDLGSPAVTGVPGDPEDDVGEDLSIFANDI